MKYQCWSSPKNVTLGWLPTTSKSCQQPQVTLSLTVLGALIPACAVGGSAAVTQFQKQEAEQSCDF